MQVLFCTQVSPPATPAPSDEVREFYVRRNASSFTVWSSSQLSDFGVGFYELPLKENSVPTKEGSYRLLIRPAKWRTPMKIYVTRKC